MDILDQKMANFTYKQLQEQNFLFERYKIDRQKSIIDSGIKFSLFFMVVGFVLLLISINNYIFTPADLRLD